MSRVYVAGKWEDREKVRRVQARLRALGDTITHDWTNSREIDREEALRDIEGVKQCDMLVAVLSEEYNHRGTWVEIGAALALGRPVYIIGNGGPCIFTAHPLVTHIEEDLGSI